MDLTTLTLATVTIVGTLAGIAGYFLMRQKFERELESGQARQVELAQKAYETAVLKEIGDRIGYSLDGAKIVEIVSGSLGKLLPYSAVSHIILDSKEGKVRFACNVSETVSSSFVREVKTKMLAAVTEMNQEPLVDTQVDEAISGTILDDSVTDQIGSFFNLPIIISGKLVGLINVSSRLPAQYNEKNTEVLYRIAKQASEAVSRLQDVLENEKGRLSQAVDSLSDGLLMVDTKYQLAIVNRKLRSLLKVSDKPEIFDIVNALSGQLDLRTKMEEAIAKGEVANQEISVAGKVLQVYASRVMDRGNIHPIGVVVLFHDITDARALESLRSEFMSMMVHELRAPLTSIKSSVELLKPEATKSENQKKYLGIIDSTSQTMLELVNDLLDVAKLESGKFDIIAANEDLAPVIKEKVEAFEPIATIKGLKIALAVEENLPKAYFDKIRTKQVLGNLLSNAIKYSQSGTITVSAKKEVVNGSVVDILVSVSDTGIGIDPEDIGKLFSRFGQLAAGRSAGATTKSSGLGLFITRGIVEGQNGKIWVESQGAGSGSTFYFTIPAAKVPPKVVGDDRIVFSTKKVAQA
ncbi:MAG: ATP-binding protein [Candidatus Curtissbacteria bacterium]